jgi:hypothetical protein
MRARGACALLVAAVCIPSAGAATARPGVVVLVGSTLRSLDPRTLSKASWSYGLESARAPIALSPDGRRLAVGALNDVLVLDTATGRVVTRYAEAADSSDPTFRFYWLGNSLVTRGFNCDSGGCGDELAFASSGTADDFNNGTAESAVPLHDTLALAYGPTDLEFFPSDAALLLPQMTEPSRLVADPQHQRLYEISSGASLVAEIDDPAASTPHVRYHRVALNGKPFSAAWAGHGRIALWGEDGLGTIDTRTWTTHALLPAVGGVVCTAYGVAAWDIADGVSLYAPSGSLLLHALGTQQVRAITAVGPYLYARTRRRYSIDLRSGAVAVTTKPYARILTP